MTPVRFALSLCPSQEMVLLSGYDRVNSSGGSRGGARGDRGPGGPLFGVEKEELS